MQHIHREPTMVTAQALGLTSSQLTNALGIIAAVQARGWPAKAAYIAVETALTESGMRVLASGNVPSSVQFAHDLLSWTTDGLGHDHASVGMYQQQVGPSFALAGTSTVSDTTWGTPAQLMDPQTSTAIFLDRLAQHDWQHMDNWLAAQAVQGSAFADGSNYRQLDAQARQIVDALWSFGNALNTTQQESEEDEMILILNGGNGGRSAFFLSGGKALVSTTNAARQAHIKAGGRVETWPTAEFTRALQVWS
jgi:hypothetical protein